MLAALTSQVRSRMRPDRDEGRSVHGRSADQFAAGPRPETGVANRRPSGRRWASRRCRRLQGRGGRRGAGRAAGKVAVVAPATQGRTLTYSGVVRPRIESALGFRVAGKIVERAVNVGDRVEVGQVIARLDETDLKLAENAAKAAVAAARSRRDVAQRQSGARQGPAAESDHLAGDLRHQTQRVGCGRGRAGERGGAAAPGRQRGRLHVRSRPTRPASSRP